jgi:hypothetical protein
MRAAASRICRQRSLLWTSSSSASSQLVQGQELWLNGGLLVEQQQRSYAKEAAPSGQKIATPNAAKNVKAKNTTKKEEKKEQRERFNDLIDACLNAPSPLSPLKEKDKLRLLERERLGVISQERLREIELEKTRAKLAKAAKKKTAKVDKEAKPVELDDGKFSIWIF